MGLTMNMHITSKSIIDIAPYRMRLTTKITKKITESTKKQKIMRKIPKKWMSVNSYWYRKTSPLLRSLKFQLVTQTKQLR